MEIESSGMSLRRFDDAAQLDSSVSLFCSICNFCIIAIAFFLSLFDSYSPFNRQPLIHRLSYIFDQQIVYFEFWIVETALNSAV